MATAHKCDRCGGYFDNFEVIKIVPTDADPDFVTSKGVILLSDRSGDRHGFELCSKCNRELVTFMHFIIRDQK